MTVAFSGIYTYIFVVRVLYYSLSLSTLVCHIHIYTLATNLADEFVLTLSKILHGILLDNNSRERILTKVYTLLFQGK